MNFKVGRFVLYEEPKQEKYIVTWNIPSVTFSSLEESIEWAKNQKLTTEFVVSKIEKTFIGEENITWKEKQ